MTRKELTRNYWRYYRMLEDKFRETIDYVEIATTNFFTYSNGFAMLLQSIGSELDNVFKVYCGFNPTERKNITDYANSILNEYPAIVNDEIRIAGTDVKVVPFQGWTATAAAQSLSWCVFCKTKIQKVAKKNTESCTVFSTQLRHPVW